MNEKNEFDCRGSKQLISPGGLERPRVTVAVLVPVPSFPVGRFGALWLPLAPSHPPFNHEGLPPVNQQTPPAR
jgi:hypothetical protein